MRQQGHILQKWSHNKIVCGICDRICENPTLPPDFVAMVCDYFPYTIRVTCRPLLSSWTRLVRALAS